MRSSILDGGITLNSAFPDSTRAINIQAMAPYGTGMSFTVLDRERNEQLTIVVNADDMLLLRRLVNEALAAEGRL